MDSVVDLHEHQSVAFPVTDLDAYERRMRWRARFGGFVWIWLGVIFWSSASRMGPTPWSAIVAILVGSLGGFGVWAIRRRLPPRFLFDVDPTRSLREIRTWLILFVSLFIVVALYLGLKLVFAWFDVDLTFGAFAAAAWASTGVAAILDAPHLGRQKRDQYERDLVEIASLPARPDPPAS